MSIQIQKVTDAAFQKYGRILTPDYDVAELVDKMQEMPCPADVVYELSVKELEALPIMSIRD